MTEGSSSLSGACKKMINKLINWSLENRFIVIVLGIILFIFGTFSAVNTPVDIFPEFAPPQVVIQTQAPGFASEEVESLVTIPLESALNGTSMVQTVRSSSSEGLSFITVVFEWGTDIYDARQLVTEKVQIISSKLPQNVKKPILSPITSPIGSIYFFALTGKETPLREIRTYADWEIRNKLLSIPGVANVIVYGGEVKQYQVLLNPKKLKQYEISLSEVISAVDKANVIVGGGYLLGEDKEYLIRGIGKVESLKDLESSVVSEKNGIPIYLGNLAKITVGSALKRSDGSVDGKDAVIVAVSKQPQVNTLELSKKVIFALTELKKTLPKDIKITQTYSQADFVQASIKNIVWAMFQGSILVIVVLVLFLGSLRSSFISLIAIPVSIVTAILVLKAFGQTINAMTLGGLAVAVGEIVDDAIIDVENIYRRLRENKLSSNPKPIIKVIFNASCEVRNSVVYGTYIITIVFIPVLFLSGLAGQIFKPLAWAYITSLFASLLVALTLTPAMSFYLVEKDEKSLQEEPKFLTNLKQRYLVLLDKVLTNPKKIINGTIIAGVIAITIFFFSGKSFLPELGEENLVIMAIAPPGSSLSHTQKIAILMEKILLEHKEVIRVGNRGGRSESDEEPITANISHFDVTLKEGISQGKKEKLIKEIREDFEKLPGVVTLIRSFIAESIENVLTGQRAPIVIKLYGNDLEMLRKKASEIGSLMSKIRKLTEVQVEPLGEIPQIQIKIKKLTASRYGLKTGDLLETVKNAYNGTATSQKIIRGQKAFDLFVWFEEPYRNNLEVIKNTLIDTPKGVKVPLGQVAEISQGIGYNTINRERVSRRIVIQANAKKADLSKAVEEAQRLISKKISLPQGYTLDFEGDYKQQKEANQKLFLLSVVVLACIYLLLSLAFKSLKVAGIIMLNLPLALIGGVIAITLTSKVFSVASMIGFITLFGISTRNSILLVNRFYDIQKENPSMLIEQVIKQGALDRLAPILMTALTAAFAMLPLALFPGAGREIEHPLAIVIVGGMFSATALTLLVIPVVYKRFAR